MRIISLIVMTCMSYPYVIMIIQSARNMSIMQDPFEGLVCTRSGNMLQVTWLDPTAPFPDTSILLFANDTNGAPAVREVSVVLCQCNNGTCRINNTTLQTATFDSNGYYQWPCQCPLFFSGDSCEVDERGCGEFSMCYTSECVNDSSQASGYRCGNCLQGYAISRIGEKCSGKFT